MNEQQIDDNGDSGPELPTVKLSTYRIGCLICTILGIIVGWNLKELFT